MPPAESTTSTTTTTTARSPWNPRDLAAGAASMYLGTHIGLEALAGFLIMFVVKGNARGVSSSSQLEQSLGCQMLGLHVMMAVSVARNDRTLLVTMAVLHLLFGAMSLYRWQEPNYNEFKFSACSALLAYTGPAQRGSVLDRWPSLLTGFLVSGYQGHRLVQDLQTLVKR